MSTAPAGAPGRVTATEALGLRRWALEACSGGGVHRPAPRASNASWLTFLAVERCALPLLDRLTKGGGLELLTSDARSVLGDAALSELQRVLAARSQIGQLGELAARPGWDVCVLKGGVAAVDGGRPVDLIDLDLLVARDRVDAWAEALAELGYDVEKPERSGGPPAQRTTFGLPIELHVLDQSKLEDIGASAFTRARGLDSSGRVLRLGTVDHLWHLLTHCVVYHAGRQGNLRDLILLEAAAAECSPEEQAEVGRRAGAHAFRGPLVAVLRHARALGTEAPERDAFGGIATANYLLRAWRDRPEPFPSLAKRLARPLPPLLAGGSARRRFWVDEVRGRTGAGGLQALAEAALALPVALACTALARSARPS